ncbi:MAG TPA: glutamate synthase large subunit [Polyangiaceae bacterium]|jgi:glutamate synthase domain-containing protein 2/glutamate synthase domain-containing protein 1/glutamate synthase domain-containing protein 3|nr:glutamate synthase large subunit [Polyangiaceae bacterium]
MTLPPSSGLYDPKFEHDACGFGFVANLHGRASHEIVRQGIQILVNLTHRGACGCDPLTGDGAGLLLQLPHKFFAKEAKRLGFSLPEPGKYGAGFVFMPTDPAAQAQAKQLLEDRILGMGQRVLGWRDVPIDEQQCGPEARRTLPAMKQVFIGSTCDDVDVFERKLYTIRKWAENTVRERLGAGSGFYLPSVSARTIVYKGLLLAEQLGVFYKDFSDEDMVSALAMVHQRFSTNTFPTWELAQPFHMLCHNGEINTLRGNLAWMTAREQMFGEDVFGEDMKHMRPVITPNASDSASLDNAIELLFHGGRELPHVMMMMVPEAWQNDDQMPALKREFYEYHSCLMEPWDGPAALAFTDGRCIGAILDRNGLRPARWLISEDGTVIMASETGVLPIAPESVVRRGRLEPGKMFLVDLEQGRVVEDEELKTTLASRKPYGAWLKSNKLSLKELPEVAVELPREALPLTTLQKVFGYTLEDLRILMEPMATTGAEATGSMGTDTPLAILSDQPQLLYTYFKQHFAQVTNPPIDPIREELVMSLKTYIGREGNVLHELPDQAQMLELSHPILSNDDVAKLRAARLVHQRQPPTLRMLYKVKDGDAGLKAALDELCREASVAIENEYTCVVLSDRGTSEEWAPVPALLATAAVHHHLVRAGTRMKLSLIVESGEPREVHHFCLLLGYGATAVNPYLAMDTMRQMIADGGLPGVVDPVLAQKHFMKAINKGIKKVMSKMGISTLQSYRGAQIFEAIGLAPAVVERYFTGTSSRISGIDLQVLAQESLMRHQKAFPRQKGTPRLDLGGNYHYRAQGERHLWSPRAIGALQRAVRLADAKSYQEYAAIINEQAEGFITLRSLWDLDLDGANSGGPKVPLEEVEPAKEIVKRFATGAMSFGSISGEAHENLARAMNAIGGRSNTGEGGERPERFLDDRRSSIKQVASARFGVTTHYLVNADELQIKMAQGAKPGEGGQLPGHKVDEIIAKTRNSTPGVTLISPPPHHDIYSIEDLAQLIYDLKMVNPKARISVKLVAEAGVGTVAAGVAKAHADVILISGHDGGTGASPLTSIKHAGVPWELGLAETHQVLVKNDLRSRVRVQTDGQMRTGRDVVFAALLGAEEFGFATAPLVASGCILMRKCHLNTCPVGIATQDPELRQKFEGKPEHVIRFMFYVAEEARALMAQLGYRTIAEMVGHTERIKVRDVSKHWKVSKLDFGAVLSGAKPGPNVGVVQSQAQDHGVERSLDVQLIERCKPALEPKNGKPEAVTFSQVIRNTERTVGTQLAGQVAIHHGAAGLPAGTIRINFEGTAGQSFGAFMAPGMDFDLIGDANDYVGKGMAGGIISVRPPKGSKYAPEQNVLVGNVVLYGATGGKAFFNGVAGERFCVRNSGATAVVEGVGDHACEYMTGGIAVVLGKTGRNFAAGMSGGIAYVLDSEGKLEQNSNLDMIDLVPPEAVDLALVRDLIEEHVARTDSPAAKRVLGDWDNQKQKIVKVFPKEYRRVLRDRAMQGENKGSSATVTH